MKKTILLILMYLLVHIPLLAQNPVSINMQRVPIKEVFSDIQKKYGYSFVYSNNDLDDKQTVSINVHNSSIQDLLNQLLKGKNVSFEVKGNQVILNPLQNQIKQKKISGIVLDEAGDPIIGATVIEDKTNNATLTDVEGKFTITVKEDAKVVFSSIGFKSQAISVAGRSLFNITLLEDSKLLSEVVVTALGIKREEKALGYAVQKVAGEGLQTIKGVDMATSLTGKVSGLMVKNSTEFAEAPILQIRGESPLLVIDGVPYANMTLRDIPADDIENISILKGATASALYGYRGSSGAVMVTTKSKANKKGLSISINSSTMFTAGYLAIPEAQTTFGRGTTGVYNRTADRVWGQVMDGTEIEQWDPISKSLKVMPYLPVGKNNFKNFIRQGFITNNNINIIQQGELGSFRASASWMDTKGQYPNSKFDKYTYSIGGDMKIDKFTLSSSFSYNKHTSPNAGFSGYKNYDPMYSLLLFTGADYDVRDYKDYWLVKDEKFEWIKEKLKKDDSRIVQKSSSHLNTIFLFSIL